VGLVLGGRGAWRVCLGGVVGAVVELKDRVGVIVGTSAGALIAALFGHANQEARSATRMEPRPQRRHNGPQLPVRSYPRRGRRARCRTTGLGARERLFITVAGYKSTTDDYYNYSDQGVLRSVFEPRTSTATSPTCCWGGSLRALSDDARQRRHALKAALADFAGPPGARSERSVTEAANGRLPQPNRSVCDASRCGWIQRPV
jgi:hypothetical protein